MTGIARDERPPTPPDVSAFLAAAVVPHDAPHVTGALENALELLAQWPAIAYANVFTAAVLGDHGAIGRMLAADPTLATSKGGPYEWDALTHLCFSRFLRLDPERRHVFVLTARLLLAWRAMPS